MQDDKKETKPENKTVPLLWRLSPGLASDLATAWQQKPKPWDNLPFWIASGLTGGCLVIYAQVFSRLEKYAKTLLTSDWIWLLAPVAFFVSWVLVYLYAKQAKGSGIPQVMASVEIAAHEETKPVLREQHLKLQRQIVSEFCGMKTAVVKIFSSLICVLGLGAIGREGPSIQIATGLFISVFYLARDYFPQLDLETCLIAGGGAGLAAAFNTPLGGLVFAVEELSSRHLSRFRTGLITSVLMAGLAALWFSGSYLYLGAVQVPPLGWQSCMEALLSGAVCGIFGGLFGMLLYTISLWRRKHLGTFWRLAAFALGCGLLMAIIGKLAGPDAVGSGRDFISQLLAHEISPKWSQPLTRFFSPIISYAAGGAGGIFSPSLASGAAIGMMLGKVFNPASIQFYALMGMAGFLTGVTHAPFTSLVLIMEMTGQNLLILPLGLATQAAFLLTRMLSEHGFYEKVKIDMLKDLQEPS